MLAETAETLPAAPAPTREQILQLERTLRASPDQVDLPATHTFGPGFYARTIQIPAGATLTGKVHATEHIFILSRGEMLLATEDGRLRVRAPFQCIARPGLKRAGHALTECEVTNIHVTTETDLDKLETALIVPEAIEHEAPAAALEG